MKKIAIITAIRSLNNYGQILQAYALSKYCTNLGYESKIIDFAYEIDWYTLPPESIKRKIKLWIKLSPLYNLYQRIIDVCHFLTFKKQHLHFYKKNYPTYASLTKDPPKVDILMTGSDQVWGNHIKRIEPFMLNFGSDNIKRIGYAPSFGASELTHERIQVMKPLIARYSALGVREMSGISIAETLGYNKAQWVPDPTILLSKKEWMRIASETSPFSSKDKKRIFVYLIGTDNDCRILNFISQIPKSEVIIASDQRNYPRDKKNLTIPQWLSAVNGCDLVITNSFHGTMFSLIFNKQFITFGRIGKASGMNVRVESIMNMVGLNNRLIKANLDVDISLLDEPIDWNNVDKTLLECKKIGQNFLQSNL